MGVEAEKLLETMLDLERSRTLEKNLRVEYETLLKGLRKIADAQDHEELCVVLLDILRALIEFDHGFLLQEDDNSSLVTLASTFDEAQDSSWSSQTFFKKILAGAAIASFDVSVIPEWQQQPQEIRGIVGSALHIGILGGRRKALLILTHPEQKYFTPEHVKKIKRFAPLASQAFITFELQNEIIQRNRFFELSMDMMGILDLDGNFKQASSGWDLLGYNQKEMLGASFFDLIHEEDRESFLFTMENLHETDKQYLVEGRFVAKNGGVYWLSCSLAAYKDDELSYVVARDITDRVNFEERLEYVACHDALTGLYNRFEFLERLKSAFARSRRERNYIFAILYLDLNKFKDINDTLGHDVGDGVLVEFSECLKNVVREVDSVARWGGDEFIVLLDNIISTDDIVKVISRIHATLDDTKTIKGYQLHISTSIGVALSSDLYEDVEAMINDADRAMYEAKSERSLKYVLSEGP